MVNPGINYVDVMSYFFCKDTIRCAPIMPNSPRDIGVGVILPRAMWPDITSKSKVRHTIYFDI